MKLGEEEDRLLKIEAQRVKMEILQKHIVRARDLPGFERADQPLVKMMVMVMACESLVHAAEELVKQLERESQAETKEKEEWN